MNEPNDSLDDPLDASLGVIGGQPAADQLRAAVLAQTIGVMRRRRRLKRCALAGCLLGCYLAGIGTVGTWRPGGKEEPRVAAEQVMTPESQRRKPLPPLSPRPADLDKSHVVVAKLTPFESWRRIGDHYLRESGDISLAVAGYSQALDLASDEERAIAPGQDNWLLMALKDARVKERKHGYSQQN